MSFFSNLFATKAPRAAPHSPALVAANSRNMPASQGSTRRELLRVVLRDTMIKHGIPTAWLAIELLLSTDEGPEPRMHVRLLIKHWDPRLLECAVAFQQSFYKRVSLFDPQSTGWLSGVSWQFALDDESACPPLPDPSVWATPPQSAHLAPAAAGAATLVAATTDLAEASATPEAAAPPRPSEADQLQELRRLFEASDAQRATLVDDSGELDRPFRPTEPAGL